MDNYNDHIKDIVVTILTTDDDNERIKNELTLGNYGWDAQPILEEMIKNDPIDKETGFTANSRNWNYLILQIDTFGDRDVALYLASLLASIEPKNALTLNNLGTVFIGHELFEDALKAFKEAYEIDKKGRGVTEAKKAPAYNNMIMTQNILHQISTKKTIPRKISSRATKTTSGPQGVITIEEWRQMIWGDLVMGLFSGFLVSILTLWASLTFSEPIAQKWGFIIALVGFVVTLIVLFMKRQETWRYYWV